MNVYRERTVEQVRRIRAEHGTSLAYDLGRMADDLREKEKRHPDKLVLLPPKTPRR
jgi:hypothetical protein